MPIEPCTVSTTARRRTFWTTQPCDSDELCRNTCGSQYGLKHGAVERGFRSIVTDDFVRSLALNILLTHGRRPDAPCGYRPGARGGHWSDSYRPREYQGTAGSMIATLNSHKSVDDALAELRALVKYDMQRLVTYQVATAVDVAAEYLGNNAAKLTIKIFGFAGDVVSVGATLTRVKNSWAWET
jgi:phage gp46-like protein